jgi:hypothetical protein
MEINLINPNELACHFDLFFTDHRLLQELQCHRAMPTCPIRREAQRGHALGAGYSVMLPP